jgi:hypothetical protein
MDFIQFREYIGQNVCAEQFIISFLWQEADGTSWSKTIHPDMSISTAFDTQNAANCIHSAEQARIWFKRAQKLFFGMRCKTLLDLYFSKHPEEDGPSEDIVAQVLNEGQRPSWDGGDYDDYDDSENDDDY